MQSALHLIYPPQCVSCDAPTDTDFALCPECWRDTPFISGLSCDLCGEPLPGEDEDSIVHCDACMTRQRPWTQGRSALLYRGNARRMILALKHGDRPELARSFAPWLARAAADILHDDLLIVPIPIHWTRRLKRRYNQAAELSRALSRETGLEHAPQALIRPRRTAMHDGMSVEDRFANMHHAILPHPKYGAQLMGRDVLLLDDVMTSGATFHAAAHAAIRAGAASVKVLSLARVARDA
ncbi:ComF family protein [Aliiroseovarius sp. PrR006]|uniref:ComF family protein n=1 Tax=Aliiroseovarius sp. PrR006 TaxID=2706883 RepID=UPI0013D425AC|nr:ComF family protein [Aliiroseovarius sp. PrR006]NDW54393.1 ComF family protein [Aliiroseovarius sp. PrR006]